jgi:DtxR family Mn-dependent transcriptional regulator
LRISDCGFHPVRNPQSEIDMTDDSITGRAHHADEEGEALPLSLDEALEAAWVAEEAGSEDAARRPEHFRGAVSPEGAAELERRGLVERTPGGALALTDLGRRRTESIIRRHRLAERLVCDVLHADIAAAEDSACVFEHLLAPDIADAICTLLGHPRLCPHGHPIPGGDCCRRDDSELSSVIVRLSRLKAGQKARIAYLEGEASPRIQKLLSLGLTPGRTIELLQRWPVIVVRVDATQVALDFDVADSVSVYSPL